MWAGYSASPKKGERFVAELVVDGTFQRRGIGTEVMNRLAGEATRLNKAALLSVARINPAVRLYERLGSQITHEGDNKLHMKRHSGVVSRQ
jgi:ribosomal protein S18 acetylase RimI-like enzyme